MKKTVLLLGATAAVCAMWKPNPLQADVIPVFIFAGQSNAVGSGTNVNDLFGSLAPYAAAQNNVLFWGPTQQTINPSWGPFSPPTDTAQIVTSGAPGGFGPEISTGKAIQAAIGGKVAEVKFAINSTSLYSDWAPETNLYLQLKQEVNAAVAALPTYRPGSTPQIAGFFWMQGESDAVANFDSQYQTNLTNFIAAVRSDFGNPNLPFIMGGIDAYSPSYATVRAAQGAVAASVPHTALVNTDNLARNAINGQTIHFNSKGMVDLGNQMAAAYATLTGITLPAAPTPTLPAAGQAQFSDGSFEIGIVNPNEPAGTHYQLQPSASPWKFSLTAGISQNGGSLQQPLVSAVSGSQIGIIQGSGWISEDVAFDGNAKYTMTWSDNSRAGEPGPHPTYRILLDGADVSPDYTPGNGSSLWTLHSLSLGQVAAGVHNIMFETYENSATDSHTIFFDQAQLSGIVVPEPSSLALLVLGAVALLRRRSHHSPAKPR